MSQPGPDSEHWQVALERRLSTIEADLRVVKVIAFGLVGTIVMAVLAALIKQVIL